jgi:thiol:disulfide interchange protein DsbC
MSRLQRLLSGAVAALWCTASAAQVPAKAAPQTEALAAFGARFKAANPNTRIDSISLSTIPGLFEVVMGKNVAYVEPSGRYALFGHIFDMQERRDLTADRKAALDKVDVKSFPTELAIRHVRGTGARVLYVFSDPQCGFCKALEQALAGVDDITVYTFLTPILGPESKRLATAISCSTSPADAWSAWMLKGEQPVAATTTCSASADAIARLAQSLDVAATPTLISGDGRKSAGAMSGQQLVAWLGAGAPVAAASNAPVVRDAPAAARTATAKTSAPAAR